MVENFIKELIEVNKRIPRRLLIRERGELITSKGEIVSPIFLGVSTLDIFDLDPRKHNEKPYFFQLGINDYRGMRHVSKDEAKLALGYDFKTVAENRDILAMLDACDVNNYFANAYYLGANNMVGGRRINIPVAYFHIQPSIQKSLAISPGDLEFKVLIDNLKEKEKRLDD